MDDFSEVRGDQRADEMFLDCGGMFVAGKADAPGEVVAGCTDDVTAATFEAGKGRIALPRQDAGNGEREEGGQQTRGFLACRRIQLTVPQEK